jgi:hypothetical protein
MGVRTDPADAFDKVERLRVGPALGGFFNAAVVIAEVGDHADYLFAVKRHGEAFGLFKSRMLGAYRNSYFTHNFYLFVSS